MIDDFVKPLSGIQIGDITTQPYCGSRLLHLCAKFVGSKVV